MIIVFGNTKGGTGKSTLAVHVTVDLLYRGHRVVAIDGDGDQGTFSRYWENRNDFQKNGVQVLPMPPRVSHPLGSEVSCEIPASCLISRFDLPTLSLFIYSS